MLHRVKMFQKIFLPKKLKKEEANMMITLFVFLIYLLHVSGTIL